MSSYARKIDALGGAPNGPSDYDVAYHDGHTAALEAAMEIAADADSTIAELLEVLEALTDPTGRRALRDLIDDAEALMGAVSRRLTA